MSSHGAILRAAKLAGCLLTTRPSSFQLSGSGVQLMTGHQLLKADRHSIDPVDFCENRPFYTVFPKSLPILPTPSLRPLGCAVTMAFTTQMPKRMKHSGQIVLFPTPDEAKAAAGVPNALTRSGSLATALDPRVSVSEQAPADCQVVLSGSYRKDFEGLKDAYEELRSLGCRVLSPSNVTPVRERNGFVFMEGEEAQLPDVIEGRHLDAIQRANFVWLHAPQGYVGPTASLEIGFARAVGVPVFAKEPVGDAAIRSFVAVIDSPAAAVEVVRGQSSPIPKPALTAFQHYYRRVAVQRGYKSEGPKECLLLMVEEVGELAREIRRRERLVRHGPNSESNEARELADIFLYVVHMANVLDVDLSQIVQEKELINLQRFLNR